MKNGSERFNAGLALKEAGDLAAAREKFVGAVNAFGARSVSLVEALAFEQLAEIEIRQGNPDAMVLAYQKAMDVYRRLPDGAVGVNSAAEAQADCSLRFGDGLTFFSRLDDSIKAYRHALGLLEPLEGTTVKQGHCIHRLANLARGAERSALLRQAVLLYDSVNTLDEDAQWDYVKAIESLSVYAYDLKEREWLLRRAVGIYDWIGGGPWETQIETTASLAKALRDQYRFIEAATEYRRSSDLCKLTAWGGISAVRYLTEAGLCQRDAGSLAEALTTLSEAALLANVNKVSGPHLAGTISAIAMCTADVGEFDDAEDLFESAVKMFRSEPINSSSYQTAEADCLMSLGACLIRLDRQQEADGFFAEAAEIYDKVEEWITKCSDK